MAGSWRRLLWLRLFFADRPRLRKGWRDQPRRRLLHPLSGRWIRPPAWPQRPKRVQRLAANGRRRGYCPRASCGQGWSDYPFHHGSATTAALEPSARQPIGDVAIGDASHTATKDRCSASSGLSPRLFGPTYPSKRVAESTRLSHVTRLAGLPGYRRDDHRPRLERNDPFLIHRQKATSTGVSRCVVVPSPRRPLPFRPQHSAAPDVVTAQVCSNPAEIDATPPPRPETDIGVKRSLIVVPSPI